MNQLFKDLEATDHAAGTTNGTKLQEEDIDLDNLEEELNALEAIEIQKNEQPQMNMSSTATRGMDIERPVKPAVQGYQAQKPQPSIKGTSNESFIKSLYTRQSERMKPITEFMFYSKDVDNYEERQYELETQEGKAQFFYIDVQEDFNHKSRLFVHGKVKVKGGQTVSCCLVVNNMERVYYFFKRENDQVVGFD